MPLPPTPFSRRRPVKLALLIKDWRLCKPAIIAGLIALFIPVTAAFIGRVLDHGLPLAVHPNDVADFRHELANMIYIGLGLSTLTLAAMAAMMLARERRDRSGEFLRTLPIPRRDLLGSKVFVLTLWSVALWVGAVLLAELIRPSLRAFPNADPDATYVMLRFFISIALGLITISWFFASILRSDAIATAIAIGATIAVLVGFIAFGDRLFTTRPDDDQERAILFVINSFFFTTAAVAFTAGCIITLRRRSP